MKTKSTIHLAALIAGFSLILPSNAEKTHDHHKEHGHHHTKKIAGPNGGRILTGAEPHLEFYLTAERKVRITPVDDHGKAIALGGQSITVTGGSRSKPTRMDFTKDGESLISDKAFPEGNMLPVVVQIKSTPDAKPVIEKFTLNLNDCPECDHPEYACICDHAGHADH